MSPPRVRVVTTEDAFELYDTYAHLWPDSDQTTRAAIDAVMMARAEAPRESSAAEWLPGIGEQ